MQVQAQDGEIAATAQQDFTITSVNGKVIIQAPKEILLAAGGGYIRIGKDIEIHNPGKQSQKAAGFALSGPGSMSLALPDMPVSAPDKFSQQLYVIDPTSGLPKEIRYRLLDEGKEILKGKTDAVGKIPRQITEEMKELTVLIGPKGAWSVDYLSPDTPTPNPRDEHGNPI